jgi:uncharacterized membrane protein
MSMRIVSAGQVAFAATMVGLGIFYVVAGAYPVPKGVPGREVIGYLCAFIVVASGIGLVWQRTAAMASRVLVAYFVAILLLLRLPPVVHGLSVDVYWPLCETLVLLAAAWVLASDRGLRIAQATYGLALIPFGIAHFQFLDHTASMVPNWLPAHVAWAYFTGGAFIAAGVAIVTGVQARLAAALSTLQMGGFLLLVWVPAVIAGGLSPFQQGEVVANCVLLAAAWVVTDSYRAVPAAAPTPYAAPST